MKKYFKTPITNNIQAKDFYEVWDIRNKLKKLL